MKTCVRLTASARAWRLFLACLLSLSACGENDSSRKDAGAGADSGPAQDAGPDAGIVGFEALSPTYQSYVRAVCDRHARCEPNLADTEACLDQGEARFCDQRLADLTLPTLATCSKQLQALACGAATPAECDVVEGAVAAALGTQLVGVGEVCNYFFGPVCNPGLECTKDFGCGVCQERTVSEGGACETRADCKPGLHCGPEGTCIPLKQPGSPCTKGTECAPVLLWDRGVSPANYRDPGTGACGDNGTCSGPGDVTAYRVSACNAGGLRAPCSSHAHCTSGLRCAVPYWNTCEVPIGDGEPCVLGEVYACASDNYYCAADTIGAKRGPGTCAPKKKPGAPCTYGEDCKSDFCFNNACADLPFCDWGRGEIP